MRLTKLSAFAFLLLTALTSPTQSFRAQDTDDAHLERRGTAPRSSADKYHSHATNDGVGIGAELLTRKEVSQEFAARLNRCCLVMQVAVYPKDEQLDVTLDDFTLIVGDTDMPVRPQSATVISAKLEKQASKGGVVTSESVGIGYESGTYTDPVTGQPVHVHGTTTSTGIGVGVGGGDVVPPAVAERDREVIERELSEKGLPEAKVVIPVSGYLYFSIPKQKKNTKYRLEYVVKGETLKLQLP